MNTKVLSLVAISVFAVGALVAAHKQSDSTGEWSMEKPGTEHSYLKKMEGTWDVENHMGTMVSKGTYTAKLMPGGMWLTGEYNAMMGEMPFHGHLVMGYDLHKKKYVGVWVDSTSSSLSVSEGDFDTKTKTYTGYAEMAGPDGKPMKVKETTAWKDDNTYTMTMSMGDKPMMVITYTRKK